MKNPKVLGGIAAGLLLLVLVGVFAWRTIADLFSGEATDAGATKKQVIEQVNVLPVAERPYLQLAPTADGRNVIVIIKELKKSAQSVEYLLEYETGSLLQGVQGEISLATVPAQTQQLLGSCSAGGKCSYHENVSGGKIETTYRGAEDFKLRQEWRYIDNKAKETIVSSRDGKFQMTADALASQRYAIILNSPGYPGTPTGTVVSDPYALAVSSTLKGEGSVSIRATEAGNLTIQGWDGSKWTKFETTSDEKMATAENVPLMELYLVTKE
jgi:hypothetical protein